MRMVELRCNVVGSLGDAFLVSIASDECVSQLKDAIKANIPNTLHVVDAPSLRLFLAKRHGKWLTEEEANALRTTDGLTALRKVGLSEDDLTKEAVHVMVVVPRVRAIEHMDHRVCKLSPLEVLLKKSWKVSELPKKGKFLSLFEWSGEDIGTAKDIAAIHHIVDFTGPSFYVRKEILCVLENFKKVFEQELDRSRESRERFILAGSTGMGKSCILALLCFFIAMKCNRPVVWHRRVRSGCHQTVTRLFHNEKRHKWEDIKGEVYDQLYHIFGAGTLHGTRCWFCLDGVLQDMMIESNWSSTYKLFAPPSEFNMMSEVGPSSTLCLVPYWRRDDLEDVAGKLGQLMESEIDSRYFVSGAILSGIVNAYQTIAVMQSAVRSLWSAQMGRDLAGNLLASMEFNSEVWIDHVRMQGVHDLENVEHPTRWRY